MSDVQLQELATRYVTALREYRPERAATDGLHEYDGRIGDPSESALKERVAELRTFEGQFAEIDPARLREADLYTLELLRAGMRNELFELETLRAHEWNPLTYLFPTSVHGYVKRSYAPLPERVQAMTRHLAAVPEYLDAALPNLRDELPRGPLETAMSAFGGQLEYVRGELRHSIEGLESSGLAREFDQARAAAVAAMEAFAAQLEARLPRAGDEFAIGKAAYEEMLRSGEMVELPLEGVLQAGEANLQRNEDLLRETARRVNPGGTVSDTMRQLGDEHPTAAGLIPETATMLEEIRTFLIEHDVVNVPSEVRCRVEETPPYMRWGFAFMDSPGAFEQTATEAYYYLTPVEPDWTPEQQEEWLSRFSYHTLKDVSIHEAYPGHYLHWQHMASAPSDAAKTLISYAFVEGWAHYCEQMMVETGYGNHDPKLLLAQLTEALLRNCRYIVSILMHTQGMSVDDATQFLMEHGYMDELPARREAVRGTFDPGYLNYTLGKLQFLKLREDYEREQGMGFSMREFHDRCLSYGAPPVPLLRKQLLSDGAGRIL